MKRKLITLLALALLLALACCAGALAEHKSGLITAQPVSQQMEVGKTTEFSVSVDGSAADYHYLWFIGYGYETLFSAKAFHEVDNGYVTPYTFEPAADPLAGWSSCATFEGVRHV